MLNGSFHCDKEATPQSFSMFFVLPDSIQQFSSRIWIKNDWSFKYPVSFSKHIFCRDT
jgi:hypothetical protein